jgi:hypothetical protein
MLPFSIVKMHWILIEDQYDFLLTLASHLNNDFELYASPYKPLFPGTKERPFTNPSGFDVQIAELDVPDSHTKSQSALAITLTHYMVEPVDYYY